MQSPRLTEPRPGKRPFGLARLKRWPIVALVLSPTIYALVYFGILASNRYVSEAQFVIRMASKPTGIVGFSAFLQMAGIGRSQDDIYSVQSFLGSRDAVRLLEQRLPIREYYGLPDADALARYPSLIYGPTLEDFHAYLGWMIATVHSNTTGITTLQVQSFKPEHSKAIAEALLELSEKLVNRMNERSHQDAIRSAQAELHRNEERLVQVQINLTRFRNTEVMIDPAGSSLIITETIAGLTAELAKVQTQLREALAAAPDGPLVGALRRRAAAVEAQITTERGKIRGDAGGIAQKLAEYERLVLEREFAKAALTVSVRSLELAQGEARRQQLYLEHVVHPLAPDRAMAPQRLRMILTIGALNLMGLLVAWLIWAGIEERLEEKRRG